MPDASPIVYVVDDDISVREALGPRLRLQGWHPEVFASAEEFLAHTRVDGPSCLILDVSLPDLNGLDVQKLVTADGSGVPIIFITGYGDVPTSVQAMKAGAVEFLMKPYSDEVLLDAVRQALIRSASALEAQAGLQSLRTDYASLSPRESEVMALVVIGLLNKQIGYQLGISEITVKAHRGQMMRKMNARSVPDLVNMSVQLELTPPPLK
jgi:FixJ family two-component response regulator